MGAAPGHSAVQLLLASVACLAVVPLVAAGLPLGWAVLLLVVPPAGLVVHHHVLPAAADTVDHGQPATS
jgi:hypothetical protein